MLRTLLIFICIFAVAKANNSCDKILQCTMVIKDGHLSHVSNLMTLVNGDDVLNALCPAVPTLTKCIADHASSCDQLFTTSEAINTERVVKFMCSPAGKALSSELLTTDCVATTKGQADVSKMFQDCYTKHWKGMTADWCVSWGEVKQCSITDGGKLCGNKAAQWITAVNPQGYGCT